MSLQQRQYFCIKTDKIVLIVLTLPFPIQDEEKKLT